MKKTAILLMFSGLFQLHLLSQSCLPEGITFITQAQIDSFQVNYPGCKTIQGFVWIRGADISNLEGLSELDSIYGDLIIGDYWKRSNPNLITLEGLENLNYIGEDLVLHNNLNLGSIEALSGLEKIGKSLKILGNSHLVSLTGLEGIDSLSGVIDFQNNSELINFTGLNNLKYIKGGLYLFTNSGLINLEGLDSLTVVDGTVDITNHSSLNSLAGIGNLSVVNNLYISSNDGLTSLLGLESLDSIKYGLVINNNAMLTSLAGLTNLESLMGGLGISYNESLVNLSGLEGITSIGGALNLEWNYSLSNLEGLQNIIPGSIEELWITNNQNLSDCAIQNICQFIAGPEGSINIFNNATGCNNPHEIAEACEITLSSLPYGNYYFLTQADIDNYPSDYSNCNKPAGFFHIAGDDIENLDSLSVIDTINGTLFICGNYYLNSLNGLNNVRTIRDELIIGYWEYGGNPGLSNLMGLNSLVSVGDGVLILGNDGLVNLSGFNALTTIGEGFKISDNEGLNNFMGLENLNSAGFLEVSGNDSLVSLDGLQSLININDYISISYNPLLTSISGIENINADSMLFLRIRHNESLSECSIKSVCDFLVIPESNVIIEDNASGCNSPEEVEEACEVGVEESVVGGRQSAVVCYPNPVHDVVFFDIDLPAPSEINLSVFNSTGQFVANIFNGFPEKGEHQLLWNAEGFPPGIYFYLLTTGNQRSGGKLVKLR